MLQRLLLICATVCAICAMAATGKAQCVASLPFNFVNGTVADATQVMANFNAALSCAQAAAATVNNLSTLGAQLTAAYPKGVTRNGYLAAGDAPPLFYLPETGTCVANSRVNDGGSCANTTSGDGNSFYAVFPSSGADLRQWGVKFDSFTDNTTALQAALTWMATGNTVIIPPQANAAKFASAISVTTSAYGSLLGTARESSVLAYSGTGTGITITVASAAQGVRLADLTVCTTGAGTATTGVKLTYSGVYSANPATTSIDRVTLRGCDGPLQTQYFSGTAFLNNGVSGVHFNTLSIFGAGSTIAAGTTGLTIQGINNSTFSVNNFIDGDSQFANMDKSLVYGSFVQGVTISNTFFGTFTYTGALGTGIYSAPGESGVLAGLWLTNVDFGVNGRGIDLQTAVDAISIVGGYAQVQLNNSVTEFNFPAWGGGTIVGVNFANPGSLTGITYISLNGGGNIPGTINSNSFSGPAASAISYGTAATGIAQCNNSFANTITTPTTFGSGANNMSFCDSNAQFGSILTGSGAGATFIGAGANPTELVVGLIFRASTPSPSFFHDLYCISDQAAGAGQSYTLALNFDGSDQALTCTMSGGSANSCADTNLSHSVAITATHSTAIHMTPSGGAATGTHFNCTAQKANP